MMKALAGESAGIGRESELAASSVEAASMVGGSKTMDEVCRIPSARGAAGRNAVPGEKADAAQKIIAERTKKRCMISILL